MVQFHSVLGNSGSYDALVLYIYRLVLSSSLVGHYVYCVWVYSIFSFFMGMGRSACASCCAFFWPTATFDAVRNVFISRHWGEFCFVDAVIGRQFTHISCFHFD